MILGNITLEDDVKVGAGTVCLKSIPKGKTFVGGSKGRMLWLIIWLKNLFYNVILSTINCKITDILN